jgi:hypothetical protein
MRRVAVVILAIALVGATSAGVWERTNSATSTPVVPALAQITAQVKQAVTGTGPNEFGVSGVSSVVCHLPSSWEAGNAFRCDVYGPSRNVIGRFDGTVESSSSSGEWQWKGVWEPSVKRIAE